MTTHYHGLPIWPATAAAKALRGKHAFVSFARPEQLDVAREVCQSLACDNGSFSAWKAGAPITDWRPFYEWAGQLQRVPSVDFACIPDVIDGSPEDNDALVREWPLGPAFGVPVFHMHEPLARLERLIADFQRVALGSSGAFATIGTLEWWARMAEIMSVACDAEGRPHRKYHGLRMLSPKVLARLPLASADSTNVARNIGIDQRWTGSYQPPSKEWRAVLLTERIEQYNAPERWTA